MSAVQMAKVRYLDLLQFPEGRHPTSRSVKYLTFYLTTHHHLGPTEAFSGTSKTQLGGGCITQQHRWIGPKLLNHSRPLMGDVHS
jgi:hypothetical protein